MNSAGHGVLGPDVFGDLGAAGVALRLQEFPHLHVECSRKLFEHVDGCSVHTPLKGTDIGSIDVSSVGKFLLRQSLSTAK